MSLVVMLTLLTVMMRIAVMETDRKILEEELMLDKAALPQYVQLYGSLALHPHCWGYFQGENS